MSCQKAQQFFEQRKIQIREQVDARKNPMKEDDLKGLLTRVETVFIGKGKKVITYETPEKYEEDILIQGLGRTGNLRAPAILAGKKMFIGYNDQIFNDF